MWGLATPARSSLCSVQSSAFEHRVPFGTSRSGHGSAVSLQFIWRRDTALPCPLYLPCPLHHSGAAGIDIISWKTAIQKSDLFGLIMVFVDTLDRQSAVSFMTLYKYFKA